MFGFIERDYIGRFCQMEIAKVEVAMQKQFEDHQKINEGYLEQKIIPLRGYHLISLKRDLLNHPRTINEEYGREFSLKKYEFFDLLYKNSTDIFLRIVDNEPDLICNLGCRKRNPSCFTDFGVNAKYYDRKIAEKFGLKINETYLSNDIIERLRNSSIPWYKIHL